MSYGRGHRGDRVGLQGFSEPFVIESRLFHSRTDLECARLETMTADPATVDITGTIAAFRTGRDTRNRYASFDYCFNHFQEAREAGDTSRLADDDRRQSSCLQLGFYLASWGMLRGSSGLLWRSAAGLAPVLKQIASEPASIWDLDAHSYADDADEVYDLSRRVRAGFKDAGVRASDTLVTKTMLGVFGCVPALDHFFQTGFQCGGLTKPTLRRIGQFCLDNQAEIDASRVFTLDFVTEQETKRRYSRAKVIDMVFFQQGYSPS